MEFDWRSRFEKASNYINLSTTIIFFNSHSLENNLDDVQLILSSIYLIFRYYFAVFGKVIRRMVYVVGVVN